MQEIMSFVLALLVSYGGLYVGVLLGINSPEELKPGKKYFTFAKHVLFVLFLAAIIYLLRNQWLSLVLLGVTYLCFKALHKRWELSLLEFYIVAGVFALMVSKSEGAVFLISCIVFMYGLPAGALLVEPHSKHKTTLLRPKQLYIKAFNMTADFILVLALLTLFFLLGTFQ